MLWAILTWRMKSFAGLQRVKQAPYLPLACVGTQGLSFP